MCTTTAEKSSLSPDRRHPTSAVRPWHAFHHHPHASGPPWISLRHSTRTVFQSTAPYTTHTSTHDHRIAYNMASCAASAMHGLGTTTTCMYRSGATRNFQAITRLDRRHTTNQQFKDPAHGHAIYGVGTLNRETAVDTREAPVNADDPIERKHRQEKSRSNTSTAIQGVPEPLLSRVTGESTFKRSHHPQSS